MRRTPFIAAAAALILLGAIATGCSAGGRTSTPGSGSGAAPASVQTTQEPSVDTTRAASVHVVLTTSKGPVTLELYPDKAPITVANFVKLVKARFYDGILIHRVEPGFVVQAGDPQTRGMKPEKLKDLLAREAAGSLQPGEPAIGTGGPGWTIPLEQTGLAHDRGVIAMARSQAPDSAGSQFYITLGAAHQLDGQYAVFGSVISGMAVVDRLAVGDRIVSARIAK